MRMEGLEPSRGRPRQILESDASAIPPHPLNTKYYITTYSEMQVFFSEYSSDMFYVLCKKQADNTMLIICLSKTIL